MTLDQRITHAAARVAVAWSNGDDEQAQEWQATVERLMDERDAAARYAEMIGANLSTEERRARLRAARSSAFDILKGSPDHSVVRHA
jgi:hypothetical protein